MTIAVSLARKEEQSVCRRRGPIPVTLLGLVNFELEGSQKDKLSQGLGSHLLGSAPVTLALVFLGTEAERLDCTSTSTGTMTIR